MATRSDPSGPPCPRIAIYIWGYGQYVRESGRVKELPASCGRSRTLRMKVSVFSPESF